VERENDWMESRKKKSQSQAYKSGHHGPKSLKIVFDIKFIQRGQEERSVFDFPVGHEARYAPEKGHSLCFARFAVRGCARCEISALSLSCFRAEIRRNREYPFPSARA
jgi:hypothetical protein